MIYTIPKQESLGGIQRDDIIHTRLPHFGRTMVSLTFQRYPCRTPNANLD